MPKRLVICCDGTWNIPDQQDPTNVTKLALAVAPKDGKGMRQLVFYHRGVGTSRRERFSGGVFGAGLSRNVCDTYRFIVQNYEPGDELFFFGFSRGAFTARSTVGLVRNAGILRGEHADSIDAAYALYRSRTNDNTPRGREATLFRRSYSHEARIRFIGVWDTVGALGIPISGPRLFARVNRRWGFHNTDLSTSVDGAFQALAIDEKRLPFKPTLWQVQKDAPRNQHVEQVWFPGVHSDVGGGYPEHCLSDIPLLWMRDRAYEYGLRFVPEAFQDRCSLPKSGKVDDAVLACAWAVPHPLGHAHESRKGLYRLLPPLHREPPADGPDGHKVLRDGQSIAPSVLVRKALMGYDPEKFTDFLNEDYVRREDDHDGSFRGTVFAEHRAESVAVGHTEFEARPVNMALDGPH